MGTVGYTNSVPVRLLLPAHPPEAEQDATLAAPQESLLYPPGEILDGVAVRVTDGLVVTVTVVLTDALPPGPKHVSVYVAVLDGVTCSAPFVSLVPLQPFEAVQEVALSEAHPRYDDCPGLINGGLASMNTTGGGMVVVGSKRAMTVRAA